METIRVRPSTLRQIPRLEDRVSLRYCRSNRPASPARAFPAGEKRILSALVALETKLNEESRGPAWKNMLSAEGAEAVASQEAFANAIHPTCQSEPELHCAGALARVLRQTVTHILRFTASLRARRMVATNSLEMAALRFRIRKSRSEGAASDERMASTARAVINSMRVTPELPRGKCGRAGARQADSETTLQLETRPKGFLCGQGPMHGSIWWIRPWPRVA